MYIEIQHENTESVNNFQSNGLNKAQLMPLTNINVNLNTISRESLQTSQRDILLDQIKGKDARGEEPFLDPITVFEINGEYHLCEGLHRYDAYREWFKENPDLSTEIPVMVIIGSWGDFYVHSAKANINVKPQLGRSRADKIKSVQIFLQEEKYRSLPDREIGRILQVDGKTVKKVRQTMEVSADGTATFKEKKGELLQFPKTKHQQTEESDRNPPTSEQSAEFRAQDADYFDEDNQTPSMPVVRIEPIPPNRTEAERLYDELVQLKAENEQLKKELLLLNVTRQERDDYKAIAEQQNTVPLLEKLDELSKKNKALEEEIDQLKAQPQLEQTEQSTTEQQQQPEKAHPLLPVILKEIATMSLQLAQRMGSSAIASKIKELIESNFPSEQIQEILKFSESEEIVKLEQTISRIQTERKDDLDNLAFKEDELKRSQRDVKKLQSELKLLKKQIEESSHFNSEVTELGGLEAIQQKLTELEAVKVQLAESEGKISNFNQIKKCLRTIGESVGWSADDKRSLVSGDSTEAIEKLLSQLDPGLPKDPNRQIQEFKKSSGFHRMMEKIFKNIPIENLIAVFNAESSEILASVTDGIQTNQGLIPWVELVNGNVKLEIAF